MEVKQRIFLIRKIKEEFLEELIYAWDIKK